MKNLVESQITFLITKFFYPSRFPAALPIARELLTKGSCIVAGNGIIWQGGVGNYIDREPAEGAVDCTLLCFRLHEFLSSPWVREEIAFEITDRKDKIKELQGSVGALQKLIDLHPDLCDSENP